MQCFETQRLQMRPLAEADEALYCRLYTDAEVMRHIGAPMSIAAALRSFVLARRQAQDASAATRRWVISERGATAGTGILGLTRDPDVSGGSELGIMLLTECQGKGFAAESMSALLDVVFRDPARLFIWTRQAVDNESVPRLMHRLGFTRLHGPDVPQAEWRWHMARDRWRARERLDVEKCDEHR